MTQTTSFTSAPKSAMIDGVATVTIVVSTRIMKKPRHSANNAGQGRTPSGTSVVRAAYGRRCCHECSQHPWPEDDSPAAPAT